jgi:hypothetical protein
MNQIKFRSIERMYLLAIQQNDLVKARMYLEQLTKHFGLYIPPNHDNR